MDSRRHRFRLRRNLLAPVRFYDAFGDCWSAPAWGADTLGRRGRIQMPDVLEQLTAWAKLRGEFFLLLDDAWLLATASRNPSALSSFIVATLQRLFFTLPLSPSKTGGAPKPLSNYPKSGGGLQH